jgi:hypothetical protein
MPEELASWPAAAAAMAVVAALARQERVQASEQERALLPEELPQERRWWARGAWDRKLRSLRPGHQHASDQCAGTAWRDQGRPERAATANQ